MCVMHSRATVYILRPEDNLCQFSPSTHSGSKHLCLAHPHRPTSPALFYLHLTCVFSDGAARRQQTCLHLSFCRSHSLFDNLRQCGSKVLKFSGLSHNDFLRDTVHIVPGLQRKQTRPELAELVV